ncbi:two-component sensor histidine kinase [Fischerella muscicola CCMEE 5323]|uniref:histidine kinase n=1 Tax=Fischerella muscicola CCMEE 5323 TaxID=2019572 RepID=A0A2N6K362_FISMU|nr:two-component sensor histidine kinase [Fischerella muscicola CCMEE 5323]
MVQLLNLRGEEILGKTEYDFFPKETADQFRSNDLTVMEALGKPIVAEETLLLDQQIITYLAIKFALVDEQGVPYALCGISTDISDRKQMENQLRQQAEDLEQTLQELKHTQTQMIQSEKMSSLGQLVAGVAHEINNPVNFIHGNLTHLDEYTQILLQVIHLYHQHSSNRHPEIQEFLDEVDLEYIQEDLPNMINSMKVGTQRIRQIVLSLRTFSRMDEAESKVVDIHEGIDSTLMILQHRLKEKPEHPAIEVIKEYGTLPLVECYAGQLNQVFMNILANAIDAIEEYNQQRTLAQIQANPSQIQIRTSVINSHSIQIAIADNGLGMSEDVEKQIFNPFFTTKPVGKGTGMSMSISYQIISEKHGGKLECFSTLNKGTKFVIELPIQQNK